MEEGTYYRRDAVVAGELGLTEGQLMVIWSVIEVEGSSPGYIQCCHQPRKADIRGPVQSSHQNSRTQY